MIRDPAEPYDREYALRGSVAAFAATAWPTLDELLDTTRDDRLATGLQILRGDAVSYGLTTFRALWIDRPTGQQCVRRRDNRPIPMSSHRPRRP